MGVDIVPLLSHDALIFGPELIRSGAHIMAQAVTARPSTPAIRQTRLLIDNEWVDPVEGGTFETYNPATGEVIAQVAAATAADVDQAVKAAHRALETGPWSTMDAADRGRLIFELADLVEKNAEELAALESLNCGKTITDSRGDMQGVVNTLRYYAGWADKIEGRTVPVRGNFLSYTLRQPVGVVGQIIPWNFPLLMLAWKWGPALACGNTIVMKPAEQTPLTALRLGELAIEAGFPAGVINLINGFGETAGAALVAHPDIDKIAFTGHVDTAKIIQKAAADTLKRDDVRARRQEPERHLRRRRHGRRGRRRLPRHLLPRRPVLHRRQPAVRREEDPRRSSSRVWPRRPRSAVVGDPLDPATEQGPQVSQEQMDKILGLRRARPEAGRQARDRRRARRRARASSSSRRSSTTSRTTWRSPATRSSARSSACCRSRRSTR